MGRVDSYEERHYEGREVYEKRQRELSRNILSTEN